ncbi:MAG: hypothetical protein ACOX7R_12630 [Acetivibrionales bacterium]|jgi:hypothetical protein
MKKLLLLLIIVCILLSATAVYAVGLNIESDGGDRVCIMEDVTISEEVSGDIVVVLGDVVVDSFVNGNVLSVLGDITINGRVSGEAISVLGTVKLTDTARVDGDVIAIGSIEKSPAAVVNGEKITITARELDSGFLFVAAMIYIIALTIVTFLFGTVLIFLFRHRLNQMLSGIECNTGRKIATGFVLLVISTIVLLILLITIIAPVAYILLLMAATVATSIYFGRVLLKTFNANGNVYLDFITGFITITLIKILLLYLIPQGSLITGCILFAVFSVFIYSLGVGIMFYLNIFKNKNNVNAA